MSITRWAASKPGLKLCGEVKLCGEGGVPEYMASDMLESVHPNTRGSLRAAFECRKLLDHVREFRVLLLCVLRTREPSFSARASRPSLPAACEASHTMPHNPSWRELGDYDSGPEEGSSSFVAGHV
jgi:hypothetical protein